MMYLIFSTVIGVWGVLAWGDGDRSVASNATAGSPR
jgi:hypothetical protein